MQNFCCNGSQTKKNVNLKVLTLTSRINESNKLMNHISCKCKCEFHGKKYNSK